MLGINSLAARLSLLFALVSMLLLGSIGTYLYHSLTREIAWRDDQMLQGRLERLEAILSNGESVDMLQHRSHLYDNMLGNRDNLLWILDNTGQALIEVNPSDLPVPNLPTTNTVRLVETAGPIQARLAWHTFEQDGRPLTLIAGKLLDERNQMLRAYRLRLWFALVIGACLAFLLGWGVSRHGLQPLRRLVEQANSINIRQLDRRLDVTGEAQEISNLSHGLNRMLDRLEDGFSQLSRYSADMAHELRTPLTNLLGQTQHALRRERSDAEYRQVLESNIEEYERLSRMIDSMLFLARTESPSRKLICDNVDLGEMVLQLCEYFEGMAEDGARTLINQANGIVVANHDLLRTALANLIANALRHGSPGTPIHISTMDIGERIKLCVHNHGPIISTDDLTKVFERFYRCDPARSGVVDSGGLGLAIVHSIAQWHDGEVQVESNAEDGTTFSLTLPRGNS
ncbi:MULTISPECIES: heavy metal sensor histidine kinase [Halomonadaceae]|uniref:heavy metal sensor histidine kinase n=1 Tax=Halomonadaceae TaxID=28256 RepID=UPI0012EF5559|nr:MULTISPECIES: heavy metal sensor histidine kinase [Halomonas]CAD5262389.1 Sensor protein [Halomonas sp. 113]CAD5264181.1 Sensor protein [Halomonas sp. 59]CAD5277064.1 Sensor protein [Halomonas sp. I3]CAD5285975.1 Sensor protein [Halomonas sp. 156]VXB49252.1 Sensor protein [Halomonas titanicae]